MKIYRIEHKLCMRYLLLIPLAVVLAGATEVKAQTPPPPPAGAPGPPPAPDGLFRKINPFKKSKSTKYHKKNSLSTVLPAPAGGPPPPPDPLHLFSKKKGR